MQATTHPGRRHTSTPHTGTAGHTRGHRAPGNNGGGPPRRLKLAPQRGKDTNNPSPITQSHTQPPGAAAQPADPGPNPARRGAESNVYIAHPTHGARTRPNRTRPPTAARKTTLNAGQCERQPREGRGRNRQPPPIKKQRGEGGGRENSPQPPNRPPTPPVAAKPPTQKATKTGPPKRHWGTTQPKPATPSQEQRPTGKRNTETCRHTPRKRNRASSPARKKGDGGTGTTRPGTGTPSNRHHKAKKKKRKKHTATTQPRRAGHSRDPGPARTPTPHTRTGNGEGQAERARNHTRPINRPKPKPNHEHHKQPALEGQHHKPCPNTPT